MIEITVTSMTALLTKTNRIIMMLIIMLLFLKYLKP